ncbi:MAG: ferrous iron transport protein A [Planctomycetota bacterium]|nr:ferrous iron transport protein A [Planctomycetota bacterium]
MAASHPETLDQLTFGQTARVVAVDGVDAISARLMEMGLFEGEVVESLGAAPLGDPIEFLVCGYRLSLRKNEARRVRIAGHE